MKTIGIIGGMSWESSLEYYRIINEVTKEKLGSLHSAKSVMYSIDFAEMEILQRQGKWAEATQMVVEAARWVERGGADFLLIGSNTMHKAFDEVQAAITIPIIHIADATAQVIKDLGIQRVGLLGTRFTMEESFYKGRLLQQHGLQVSIPDSHEREVVHRVIYDELVVGRIERDSQARYKEIMQRMVEQGAEGIILGCTEIGLLVHAEDSTVPLFDTARIHAEAAVLRAI